jgi:transcriptional regulator with XRE-family HTH domain
MKSSPLGRQLKAAREEAGLSIVELARRLGVNTRTVAGWEEAKPRSKPRYDRLVQVSRILGKPVSYFVDEEAAA